MHNKSLQYAFTLSCFVCSVTNAGPKLESYCRVAVRDLLGRQGDEPVAQSLNRLLADASKEIKKIFLVKNGRLLDCMFYPIAGPIRLGIEAQQLHKLQGVEQIWRAPFRLVRKDAGVIVGTLTVAYVNGHYQILQVDFDAKTEEFSKKLGQEPYVMASLVDKKNILAAVPRYDFDRQMGRFPKTFFITATSDADLSQQLRAIRAKVGPIYGLEVYGHGAPGFMPYSVDGYLGKSDKPLEAGVFQKNAQIKLNACDVGNGPYGEYYVKDIGQKLLAEGGTVYSSRVSIGSNFVPAKMSEVGISGWPSDAVNAAYQTATMHNPITMVINMIMNSLAFEDKFPEDPVRITPIPARD